MIDVGDEFFAHGAGDGDAGASNDQGHANARFEDGALAAGKLRAVIAHEDHEGIFLMTVSFERREEIADPGIESRDAVVVIGGFFEQARRFGADPIGQRDLIGGLRIGRTAIRLAHERQVSIGEVDGQIPGLLLGLAPEFTGGGDIVGHRGFAVEISLRDRGIVEGEGALGIDVEFSDDPRPVAARLQVGDDIWGIGLVEFKAMGCEPEMAVLVGVEPGESAGPRG